MQNFPKLRFATGTRQCVATTGPRAADLELQTIMRNDIGSTFLTERAAKRAVAAYACSTRWERAAGAVP